MLLNIIGILVTIPGSLLSSWELYVRVKDRNAEPPAEDEEDEPEE